MFLHYKWMHETGKEKIMKKGLGVFLAVTLLSGVFVGCGKTETVDTNIQISQEANQNITQQVTQETTQEATEAKNEFVGEGLNEAKKIIIGYQPNEGMKIVEESQHYVEKIFAEDGIEIEWVEFAYGAPLVEALAAGSIDVGTSLGDTAFINAKSNDAHVQGIYIYPMSKKGIAIVLSKESSESIKTLEDLKGKRIAYLAGSLGEDFIVKQLGTVNITKDDVEFVNISSTENQFAALLSGDVDAVISNQPKSSNFIDQNGGALLDYGESKKKFLSLGVANTDFAEKNPEIVAKFVAARLQADQYIENNLDEYKQKYSELTGFPVKILDNFDSLDFRTNFADADYETLDATMQFMIDSGAADEKVDLTGSLTNKYLDEAKRILGIQ